jgi:CDP-glucose 4,6-dehydratase
VWGGGSWTDNSDPAQVHEAGILQLNIERAKNELNWIPKLTARESIDWTIEWFKKPVTEQLQFTFEQINNYFSK